MISIAFHSIPIAIDLDALQSEGIERYQDRAGAREKKRE